MNSDFEVALHALTYLLHKNARIQSSELSETICTNPTRVRKVMRALINAKLIDSIEGKQGGYYLIKDDISYYDILKALNITPIEITWHTGQTNHTCKIAKNITNELLPLYDKLNQDIYDMLKNYTIKDLEENIRRNYDD